MMEPDRRPAPAAARPAPGTYFTKDGRPVERGDRDPVGTRSTREASNDQTIRSIPCDPSSSR